MGRNGPERTQWGLNGTLREPPPTPLTQPHPPAQVHTLLFGQYLTQCPETPTLTAPPTPQSHSQHSQHGNPHLQPYSHMHTVHKNVCTQHRHIQVKHHTHCDTYTIILAHMSWVSLGQVLGPPKGRRPLSASPTSLGWQHRPASVAAVCQLGKFRAPGLQLRRDQKGEEDAHWYLLAHLLRQGIPLLVELKPCNVISVHAARHYSLKKSQSHVLLRLCVEISSLSLDRRER